MILGIDPKIDYAFKLLLGRDETRPLLIDLLNSVLRRPEGERVESVELLNPFNPKAAFDDKLSIVDVRARDQGGRLFNVEMQMLGEESSASRIVYYAARTFQQQLHEGDDYDVLRQTISVCFLNHVLFPDVTSYHLCFRLLETTHRFSLTDDLEFHFLELPKFQKAPEELSEGLEVWLYFLRYAEKIDTEAVPATLQQPLILKAFKELEMVTQDEIERIRYESSVESERAYKFNLRMSERKGMEKGLEKGMEKGLEKGMEKGLEKGIQVGRQEGLQVGEKIGAILLLERWLGKPESPTDSFSGLSLEELDRQVEQLERQFRDLRR